MSSATAPDQAPTAGVELKAERRSAAAARLGASREVTFPAPTGEQLDWAENQRRSPRDRKMTDLLFFGLLLAGSVALSAAIWLLFQAA